MKFRATLVTAIFSATLLATTALAPAASATEIPTDSSFGRIFDIQATSVDPRLEQVSSFLSLVDGVPHFDYASAAIALDLAFLDEFAGGFATVGHVDGTTKFDGVEWILDPLDDCRGRNQAWTDGWGIHIEMDACKVVEIVNAMNLVSGVLGVISGILLLIPGIGTVGRAIAAIAGGVLKIAAGILKACGFPGGRPVGATLHITGVPWCGTQS